MWLLCLLVVVNPELLVCGRDTEKFFSPPHPRHQPLLDPADSIRPSITHITNIRN
jgi:hypothetical protein